MNLVSIAAELDLREVLYQYKERLVAVETTVENTKSALYVAGVVSGAFLASFLVVIWKAISRSVEKRIDESVRIAVKESALPKALSAILSHEERASQIIDEMTTHQRNLALLSPSELLIQNGEVVVVFANTGYKNVEVKFPKPFPVRPQIFVGERTPGAWIFAKVDETCVTTG